jgi:hypothetical protein
MFDAKEIIDKKILLIAPNFYSYHLEIISTIESYGANVTFYPEMQYSAIFRIVKKIDKSKFFETFFSQRYITKIIEQVSYNSYDLVLVIRGAYIKPYSIQKLKKILPAAPFILYQWDSIKQNNYLDIVEFFDYVYTFDSEDAEKHNLPYLPLFYINNYGDIKKKHKKYDLVFYGAYHSDRLEIIKFFHNKCSENGLIFKSHLFVTKLALIRLILTGVVRIKDVKFFKTHHESLSNILDSYSQANSVLDIELSIQSGLSIRTFEALSANLKLITTNSKIMNENFYDPNRIYVIDRENLKFDFDFLKSDCPRLSNSFQVFSIDSWIKTLLLKNKKS